jgi:hypothetical protein
MRQIAVPHNSTWDTLFPILGSCKSNYHAITVATKYAQLELHNAHSCWYLTKIVSGHNCLSSLISPCNIHSFKTTTFQQIIQR